MKNIRVVIADDSALMRKKISEILNSDPDIEVVAVAKNGKEALKAIYSLKPDVVTLDVEMPILDGIETLGYIMSEIPTPCVMISAYTKEGSKQALKALEFGAIDFVAKPGGVISPDIITVGREIIEKVKLASKVDSRKLKLVWPVAVERKPEISKDKSGLIKVFAIASSTGGTQALATLIPKLRPDIQAAYLVVQHMPAGFTQSMSERLNIHSDVFVSEARDGMLIKPGHVIIAKGGMHMEVGGTCKAPFIILSDKPSVKGLKPCADVLMESAVKLFGKKTVGVVLTGMGSDGKIGSKAIKDAGGMVIAESEMSCIIYGMPKSVIDAGLADKVVSLSDMAEEIERIADSG